MSVIDLPKKRARATNRPPTKRLAPPVHQPREEIGESQGCGGAADRHPPRIFPEVLAGGLRRRNQGIGEGKGDLREEENDEDREEIRMDRKTPFRTDPTCGQG